MSVSFLLWVVQLAFFLYAYKFVTLSNSKVLNSLENSLSLLSIGVGVWGFVVSMPSDSLIEYATGVNNAEAYRSLG